MDVAGQLSLDPRVIEKDYVIGWVLAGIFNHHLLSKNWIFKGGTCIKKCFFDTKRMSEDLDFTLIDPGQLNIDFLTSAFKEISEWVYEQSGLNIAADKRHAPLYVDLYENPRGNISCEARIYYRGPITRQYSAPKIKLDLTGDEKVVCPPVQSTVNHPYSDFVSSFFFSYSYSFEELFAEKIRALVERSRPGARDLYDVVNLYRYCSAQAASPLREILQQKCAFKGFELPSLIDIESKKEEFFRQWEQQLSHQIAILPAIEAYWSELPNVFRWLCLDSDPSEQAPI